VASLTLNGVSVVFPIYHASARSMRRFAIRGALGGKVRLDTRHPSVAALTDIDLSLADGDRLALVGANGSGKTTLLRTAAGIYPPTGGRVTRSGRVTPLLGVGTGVNLAATGLENIYLLGMHLDIPPARLRSAVDEIVAWTELGPFLGAPLRTYSAGMILRLAFAVSTAFPPDILLMDEWVGLADAEFRMKAYERMSAFVNGARIIVLASHSRDLLQAWCNRAILLEAGRLTAAGTVSEVLDTAPRTEAAG
jgi:ABC-2 type transport system ATP-binding protein/lipopolysaccharide transport system ATP-binding protein